MSSSDPWKPVIKGSLPGPAGAAIVARDHNLMSPSYTRDYPVVVDYGLGCRLWDPDGNEFLDFNAGIAVCSTGHCHPEVVAAIEQQARRLIHMSGTDFYYSPMPDLAERLADTVSWGRENTRVFFSNSGTEAVEAAIKLARHATGRPRFIAFKGSFHGRTMGSLSLTASKVAQRRGFFPDIPGVTHIPYGDCFRCPYHLQREDCEIHCLKVIEEDLFTATIPADEVAAVVVEPIQGEGGYVVPPEGWLQALRDITRKHGILLIFDEVQCGMGRTGKMWAHQHWGVEPDIICSAKGIASGMPLGATIARKDLMTWPPGSYATTFGGNPVCCAAGIATYDLLTQGGLIANAAAMGERIMASLAELQKENPCIGQIRGKGLMIGVEIVNPASVKRGVPERDQAKRDRILENAFKQGLLLLGCGKNAIRICPPLVVSAQEVDTAMDIIRKSVQDS